VVLVLLFLLPWPALISSDSPDFWMLLGSWVLAGGLGIITALLVKLPGKKQAKRATEPPRNGVSPRVWIIIAPVLFLVFCMEFEFICIPDYPNLGEVFFFWLLTGLAGLIILLALKLGSSARTDLTAQEALQQVQVQG
jgi:hypothetical protein